MNGLAYLAIKRYNLKEPKILNEQRNSEIKKHNIFTKPPKKVIVFCYISTENRIHRKELENIKARVGDFQHNLTLLLISFPNANSVYTKLIKGELIVSALIAVLLILFVG